MKKFFVIVFALLCSAQAQGADLDTFNITLKNLSNTYARIYFFYKDREKYVEEFLSPQQKRTIHILPLAGVANTLNPNDLIPVSQKENDDLKNGKAVIAFFPVKRVGKKQAHLAIRIVPKEQAYLAHEQKKDVEIEGKRAVERPEGMSAHEAEVIQLRAQLKAAQDELATAKKRITELEAQVQSLKQELQPGS